MCFEPLLDIGSLISVSIGCYYGVNHHIQTHPTNKIIGNIFVALAILRHLRLEKKMSVHEHSYNRVFEFAVVDASYRADSRRS